MEKDTSEIEEFIASLEDYQPTVPDEVTTYYLNRTGFVCTDVKMKRLIALAAQKFISDIANDALQYCKIRQQSASRDKSKARDKKLMLTMEDLSQSLKEYGINLRKPEYYADRTTAGMEVAQQQARERERERADRRDKLKQQKKEPAPKAEKEKEDKAE